MLKTKSASAKVIAQVAGGGTLYFLAILLAGTILGAVRTTWLAPRVGALAAVACEIPLMLCVVWISSKAAIGALRSPVGDGVRFCIGATAFILLQIAEIALARLLFGMDVQGYWRAMGTLAGALGLAAQLVVPWAPVLQGRMNARRTASAQGLRRSTSGLAQVKAESQSPGQIELNWRLK
jgi:hypothetical protein